MYPYVLEINFINNVGRQTISIGHPVERLRVKQELTENKFFKKLNKSEQMKSF